MSNQHNQHNQSHLLNFNGSLICPTGKPLKSCSKGGIQKNSYSVANLVSRLNQLNQNQMLESNLNFIKIPISSYFSDSYLILQLLTHLGLVQLIKISPPNSANSAHSTLIGVSLALGGIKQEKLNPNIAQINPEQESPAPFIKEDKLSIAAPREQAKDYFFFQNHPTKFWLTLVSRPGRRVYVSYKDIKDFNSGHKSYLIRSSKGIITSQTALKLRLGGELLIKISYPFLA